MDISSLLSNDTIITIAGAIVLVVVGILIFRKNPNKTSMQEKKDNRKHTENPGEKGKSGWKLTREFLKKIRSSKQEDSLTPQPVAERIDPVEMIQTPEPLDDSLIPDLLEEQVAETESGESNNITPISQGNETQETSVTSEGVIEVIEVGPAAEIASDNPVSTEGVTNSEEKAQESEKKKEKPSSGGDIFSMFTEEEQEENEISKFASTLDPVDINDILADVRNMRKYMRK